jgi:signal transduction histidine kinase
MEQFNHQRGALDQSLHILVVEDDDLDFQIVSRSLRKSLSNGCTVVRASTYATGMQMLEAEPYDIGLIDNKIGPDSGLELIREATSIYPDMPFVMLTGEVSGGIDIDALDAGADDFLDKSDLTPELLRRTIRYAVAHRRSLVSLRQTNEELERFAYVASHDLQEPLRKIAYYSDRVLTQASDALDEKSLNHLESVNKAAARMRALIGDLLSYSRVSSLDVSTEAVDVPELLQEVDEILSKSIEDHGAVITYEGESTMFADKFLMRQVLQNLISNAIRYRSSEPPNILVKLESVKANYQLSVQDNGIGFEPKFATRIFRAFERLHRKEEIAGTGIGLSICDRIARRHGGSIRAESNPGEGAIFTIEWPATGVVAEHEKPDMADIRQVS